MDNENTTNYKTIRQAATAEYEINKSRFIAYTERVNSDTEAIAFIQSIKKKHWDARHNCSAYIIGEHGQLQKADDDGEPSGTAGKPMLEVLKKNDLKDIVLVVTRYFGGIKLGAGGLIRAYGKASTMGLDASEIVMKTCFARISIKIDYTLLGTLENQLRQAEYRIENKLFTDKVQLIILTELENKDSLIEKLTDWTAGTGEIEYTGSTFLEMPVEE